MEGFCRGCLIRYDDPTELLPYTERNRRLFNYSTGIQVKSHEIDTFQLCKDCHVNMKLSCKFKKQCRVSDKKYKHYLSLKEVGDAFDLTTFLKTNDESLRFPFLIGSSTPNIQKAASEREKDDDNESTCTSIRNFMSDILQGEEVPDTEAHIIKEVIEEDNILEDTLDSQWLQDDISRDTDFKDLSFSPFSTPRSINLDHCYTPNKQLEANVIEYNKISDPNMQLLKYKDTLHETNIDKPQIVLQETSHPTHDNTYDNNGLFDEITNENINYVTQNESDIVVSNNECDNIVSETYPTKSIQNENEINYAQTQDQLAVKYLLDSKQDYNDIASNQNYGRNYFPSVGPKYVDQDQNGKNEVNFTLKEQKDVYSEHINIVIDPEKTENKIEIILRDFPRSDKNINDAVIVDCNTDTKLKLGSGDYCDNEDEKKDVLQLQPRSGNDLTLDDLLVLPTEKLKAPGASTPLINDILFGKKIDVHDQDKDAQKSEIGGGTDILDDMLKQGVKEFTIDNTVNQAAVVYDLEQLYCKSCNKKFNVLKSLKLHLTRFHRIRLPKTRNKKFDKQTRICDICGDSFTQFKTFQRHKQSHLNRQIECPKCLLSFDSEKTLKRHMKSHEKKEINDKTPAAPSAAKLVCTICGKGFANSGNFSVHMKRHLLNYTETCEECGKGFFRKQDLERHLTVHTADQTFQCKFCVKKFKYKYSLTQHVKLHIDEKLYECDDCSKKFISKHTLIRHFKSAKKCIKKRVGLPSKKPGYTYQCGYCRSKFRRKGELVKHQKGFRPCATFHNSQLCLVIDGTEQATNSETEIRGEI